MAKADFTYTFDGLFYCVLPETPEGENIWNNAFTEAGSHKLLPHHFAAFKRQARQNGYSVHKAKPVKMSTRRYDKMLRELEI